METTNEKLQPINQNEKLLGYIYALLEKVGLVSEDALPNIKDTLAKLSGEDLNEIYLRLSMVEKNITQLRKTLLEGAPLNPIKPED